MAHKFGHRWTVFTFDHESDPPQREERGTMDLTSMSDNGQLANGDYHELPTGVNRPIKGHSQDSRSLVLENADGSAKYRGVLVFDLGGNMVISGVRLTPDRAVTLDQVEEPWIITKP